MRKLAAMAVCGLLVACLAGCKSAPVADKPVTANPEEPAWVSMGARAFPEEAGKALYGVGIAPANRFPDDPFMLRRTAIDQGRAAVGGEIRTFAAAVLKDYSAAAFTPGMKPADLQSMTEAVQQTVTDATLMDAAPTASWKDSQTGDMYALVKLSMDGVAQQLRDKLAEVEKDHLKMDAPAAHKALDRIIEKDSRPAK